jgi:ribose transport system ATP-binding protein
MHRQAPGEVEAPSTRRSGQAEAGSGADRSSAPLLLQVSGVTKSFPGVKALSDMHLDLRHGEVLAVVGENGAGKSTLMKLLSGSYVADSGEFFLDGKPLGVTGPRDAQQQGISIIHQEFNLMPDLTVAQNIWIGREPRRRGFLDHRRLNADAQALLDRLQLPLDATALVSNLTVAKQQMVEIAKALSYDAKVLIMDEPTAALNDAEVAVLHGLIRRFVQPQTGVLYISHRMDELRAISDRITVIRDGQYVGTVDTPTATLREVISMMVGEIHSGPAGGARDRRSPGGDRLSTKPCSDVSSTCTRARSWASPA